MLIQCTLSPELKLSNFIIFPDSMVHERIVTSPSHLCFLNIITERIRVKDTLDWSLYICGLHTLSYKNITLTITTSIVSSLVNGFIELYGT